MESETNKYLAKARQIAEGLPALAKRLAWIWFWRGAVWGAMMAGGIAIAVVNW